ncbi:AMP-binding enzyme family protein [Mycobacterium xenopi 4042]|uniref:AMP-binding enzyme family protein n=1 Tax=Mycobacterium xenopi 4042 TaxID=1299334 RepID=X7ZWG9_MYCXE|nr:AMP-binding enzyme family protein [Mycobacterium xenopi 4042]
MVGELVNTAGAGRFEGYYNDPEATAQRMAGGAYHSGDLAYRDERGYVYFAGRLGDWLRVDGENLGTAPIERVLARYPDVTEVAVYAVPDPPSATRSWRPWCWRRERNSTPTSFAPFWPSSPISDPSSGRRMSGSAARCRVPRPSRCSNAS